MKKKIWIPIIIVVLLLVLFLPIPSGAYKDGGSRTYTALTYKIVDWNRITSSNSVYDDTKVYFFPNNFKSLDDLWELEKQSVNYPTLKAKVIEIYEKSVLVEAIDNKEGQPSGQISFGTSKLENINLAVGDIIEVTYTGDVMESYPAQIIAVDWEIVADSCIQWGNTDADMDLKPVIYLYPEKETEVTVNLTLDGKLTCTYPAYSNGWTVTASPDGTLTDKNGQTYNYLYWEGETNARYDLSKGFCVKGEDTAKFLETALSDLGLNRREANEFIVYWLPLMEQNPYNIISFQTDAYTNAAQLKVNPNPDTLIRVFMAWQATETFVDIPSQELTAPERVGFTVVEWGGTQIMCDSEIYYDSGIYYDKSWDETIGTYTMPVIRDKETAIEIATAIYNGIENNNSAYIPQYVFFDEEDEIWIVSFWEASYEGLGNCCSIALQKKDGRVLRIWFGE